MIASRPKSRTKSESKHTAFDKLLAQKVDFLPFLTGRDMTQMYQSSTKMRKPHVVKKLHEEKCWVSTHQGQDCILQKHDIDGECTMFCQKHYMTALKRLFQMLVGPLRLRKRLRNVNSMGHTITFDILDAQENTLLATSTGEDWLLLNGVFVNFGVWWNFVS